MKENIYNMKKKAFLVIFLMFLTSVFVPITSSITINTQNNQTIQTLDDNIDFSIMIHRIKQSDDEIDPWPHSPEGEWQLRMYVNGIKIQYECTGKDIIVDKNFIWENIIDDSTKYLEIRMELLELDGGHWPNEDDIADISAYVDQNYQNGDYDDTTDFSSHRPAYFQRYYNLITEEWMEVDDDNDFLQEDIQYPFYWYITSGDYDGSTNTDENDVAIWFSISVGNTAPYVPEKPVGPELGWIGEYYTYSTVSFDEDGDKIQYGWDWNGDSIIDHVTNFYDPWETISTINLWQIAQFYQVKVIAIDERGLASGWSEPLKVEINGPYGISGFNMEDWSCGKIYCTYLNHYETQELLATLRSGGNIITAAATLLSAIAAGLGVPLDISISIAIITAIVRLGVEIINILDKGMGIYFKAYIIEIGGVAVPPSFCYLWSQSIGDKAWEPPLGNQMPNRPNRPEGLIDIKKNKEYSYSCICSDPESDMLAYIYDWGDGDYSCIDYNESNTKVSNSHIYSEKGEYEIKVKTMDIYGHESQWSEPLTIKVTGNKNKIFEKNIFSNFLIFIKQINYLFKKSS